MHLSLIRCTGTLSAATDNPAVELESGPASLGPCCSWVLLAPAVGSRAMLVRRSAHLASKLLDSSSRAGAVTVTRPTSRASRLLVKAMSSGEVEAARKAASLADSDAPTLFDKIINKQIPATIIYEDDQALAFRDINPQAPTHFLVIPKHRSGLTRLSKMTDSEQHKTLVGHLMYVAQLVAKQENLLPGFRVVVNDGPDACQSVYHLHLHVIGGRQLKWPPG